MINGTHVLFYSVDPAADRTFFRDVLGFRSVDVGRGWLIFALPPAEAAFHPIGETPGQTHSGEQMLGAAIYLMCDDLTATVNDLAAKHVRCTAIATENWGIRTTVPLPSGGQIGLYQPSHPTALNL
jgi:hypothetical protein